MVQKFEMYVSDAYFCQLARCHPFSTCLHISLNDCVIKYFTKTYFSSLGGNTKTLMVACLSPADNNYDETLSTLRYANRAKNIKNKPKINEDPKDALLRQFQEEIKQLKAMLMGQIPIPQGGFEGKLGNLPVSRAYTSVSRGGKTNKAI